MSKFKFQVEIRESERGWGSKRIDLLDFETYEEAVKEINEVNANNTAPSAPDYYIQASPVNFTIV